MKPNSNGKRYNLGANLRLARSNKYSTQAAFAKALNVPYTTYSQYENNKRQPDIEMLLKIADSLDITVDSLLTNSKSDAYLSLVHDSIQSYLWNYDKIDFNTDEENLCKLVTNNGIMKISREWYSQLKQNLEARIHEYIEDEVGKEIAKQREKIFNKAQKAQYTMEARILCDSLKYDYSVINKIAECRKVSDVPLEQRIVHIIFELYFSGIPCRGEIKSINRKLESIFQAIYSIAHSWGGEIDEYDLSGEVAQDILNKVRKYKGKRNYVVEQYLKQHWELSDEEMGIMIGPFETMRSLFYTYGLNNLRMEYSATETMEEFLIGMGSNPPIL
ncbi:helix-turn-helix domain-containing protein [Anaerovibrio sp. RM50]|uniref:helix-turn-helix domain-containing protein n=1 Tax=Anaerovibrio sp. RM50 TaxID=1200557 RepID=UPI000684C182|nr:helix-turn-helix transcriptional regulator [Anaerovibrio sp. RM50]